MKVVPIDGLRVDCIIERLPEDRPVRGAEVGVLRGVTSASLLARAPNLSLIMVDLWQGGPNTKEGWDATFGPDVDKWPESYVHDAYECAQIRAEPFGDRARIMKADSNVAAILLAGQELDFVFLDADHSYEATLMSLKLWSQTLSKDGWIGGHDFDHPMFPQWGVKQAVQEFCGTHGLTYEVDDDLTFFISMSGQPTVKRGGVRARRTHLLEVLDNAKTACSSCKFNRGFESFGGLESITICVKCQCPTCKGRMSMMHGFCPMKKWDNLSDEDRRQMEDQTNQTTPAKKGRWLRVQDTWAKAKSFAEAAVSRGVVSTATDALIGTDSGKRVSRDVFSLRVLSCHGDGNTRPCAARKFSESKGYHYCDECGCGDWELASISSQGSAANFPVIDYDGEYTKLHYPELRCPLRRPGFSNQE